MNASTFGELRNGRFYGSIPGRAPTRPGYWLVVFMTRDCDIAYKKFGSATYLYAREQSPRDVEPWRRELAKFAERAASIQITP